VIGLVQLQFFGSVLCPLRASGKESSSFHIPDITGEYGGMESPCESGSESWKGS
jgi:hypothetical protein